MSPRGRGRPPVFVDAQRDLYLQAVASGLPLTDAARAAGITPQWANRVAATDPSFHTARQLAKKEGKRVRTEALPHDEYRYNHHGCRCDICRTAATAARTGRRHQETDDPASTDRPPPPHVIDIRQHSGSAAESGTPPLLARAS